MPQSTEGSSEEGENAELVKGGDGEGRGGEVLDESPSRMPEPVVRWDPEAAKASMAER